MTLDETHGEIRLALWGAARTWRGCIGRSVAYMAAIAEPDRRLKADGIPHTIVPGVPAYAAAAAAMGQNDGAPRVPQSIVLRGCR